MPLKMIYPKIWPPRDPLPQKTTTTKNLKTFPLKPLIRIQINSAGKITL